MPAHGVRQTDCSAIGAGFFYKETTQVYFYIYMFIYLQFTIYK